MWDYLTSVTMNRIWNLFKRIQGYCIYCISPIKYARWLGVKVGNSCFISTMKWSSEPYLITIGDHVQITQDVWFHTHGGGNILRETIPDFDVFGKIVIEDYAYIGSGTHILPGVTIGKGSLVAAGSIVTKSIPPREVWGGNPARFICSVDDYMKRNLKYNLATYGLSFQEKEKVLKNTEDSKFVKK